MQIMRQLCADAHFINFLCSIYDIAQVRHLPDPYWLLIALQRSSLQAGEDFVMRVAGFQGQDGAKARAMLYNDCRRQFWLCS